MAELVDASDSKSGIRKDVQVRFLFRAQEKVVAINLQPFLFLGQSKMVSFYRIHSILLKDPMTDFSGRKSLEEKCPEKLLLFKKLSPKNICFDNGIMTLTKNSVCMPVTD